MLGKLRPYDLAQHSAKIVQRSMHHINSEVGAARSSGTDQVAWRSCSGSMIRGRASSPNSCVGAALALATVSFLGTSPHAAEILQRLGYADCNVRLAALKLLGRLHLLDLPVAARPRTQPLLRVCIIHCRCLSGLRYPLALVGPTQVPRLPPALNEASAL